MKPPSTLDPILRWPEVRQQVGLSRTTVWRKIREGKFPRPCRPTDDTVGWFSSDIAKFQQERRRALTTLEDA